jgi:ubiquinone biosynthesis UbiH/UbiF/VisC/COQ6 family hydroxylase
VPPEAPRPAPFPNVEPFAPDERACEIAVVGAGLVGAAAALALAREGWDVAWVAAGGGDPAVGEWDSRVYALSPASRDWLQGLGAWDGVDASRTCDVLAMHVGGDDGRSRIVFDATEARLPRLATIVESRELARGLEHALGRHAVTRIDGRVKSLRCEPAAQRLRLADGGELQASLVVASDGAGSPLRAMAGLQARARPYGHSGVVAPLRAGVDHRGVARQWFLGGAVLALLPLPGGLRSMVWSTRDEHARWLLDLPSADFAREIARVTGGEVGSIELLAPARSFPLSLQQAVRIVADRFALVGDAAHVVHPLAGQGLNLGLGDCRDLVAVLSGRGPEKDPGARALLARYARRRAEPVATMRLATDGLFRLFGSRLPGAGLLRNRGLDLLDGVPLIKRWLAAQAAN